MLCERCGKKQATIHLTRTQKGQTTEHHFCDACAKNLGIGQQVSDYFGSVGNLFDSGVLAGGSIFNTAGGIPNFGPAVTAPVITCPVCEMSFDEFRQTGLFGCASCYAAFSDRLPAVFRRVQGATRHTGCRVAARDCVLKNKQQRQLDEMREALRNAVGLEEYEKAAELRDKIKLVQDQLNADKDKEGEA